MIPKRLGDLIADLDKRVTQEPGASAGDVAAADTAADADVDSAAAVAPTATAAVPAAGTALELAALREQEVAHLAYRSDAVQPGDLFFCIPGSHADGHDFAPDAAARGAVALAVQHPVPVCLPQIHFDDTRRALALTACAFYDNPSASLALTAVTGTNGKTTTTCLIDWICRFSLARRHAVSTEEASAWTGLIGTVETRVGTSRLPSKFTTPESLDLQQLLAQMRDKGIRNVCMEVSSHALALHRVAGVTFAAAAFSNLSQDHLDFHGSMEGYFEAKAALFDSPLVARRAIDIDTSYGCRLARRCEDASFKVLTCGCSADAQVRAEQVEYGTRSTSLTLHTPEGTFALSYPLIGGFNVSNVVLAAATASLLGFSFAEISEALACAPQIPGRLERVTACGMAADDPQQPPIGVFVDYSHTPDSIVKALDALNALKTAGSASAPAPVPTTPATPRTIIVFGCGGDRDATKRPLMGTAALAADYVVVTSDNPRSEDPLAIIADILPGMEGAAGRYEVEPDRRAAIARALSEARPGDFVLIAGKGHEDYQLVGDKVLSFDDRVVAAEELRALVEAKAAGAKTGEAKAGAVSCS
ncbi:MAG: UDP-N-acetylmuramoyl-L-alanyl-D-glutamate--2,6-diaminopimelate ligase [Coriobacteriales bacterium]|jgi:UDP-N-acetylmuramoyl-L-alanyl-D-glutamate--2,6-diaminopimelate ligase|nr:UDP-N-acetylmuramoyl-L-alanyl-D-glutamate--2,6-diaminopimelate ligase [Coriobacteriales bacterium]